MRGSAAFRTGVAPGGVLAPAWVRDALWRNARAVPSLDLNFAANKSLVDATTRQNLVTFTRSSSGTYVGSDGVLKTATTNLLLRSEEFDNASWATKALCTISQDSTLAPNGTTTADTIVEDTTTGFRAVGQNFTAIGSTQYTISCYVKAATRGFVRVYAGSSASWSVFPSAVFNLSTGTVDSGTGFIISVGSGWYRCSVTGTFGGTGGNTQVFVGPVASSGASNSYLGTGATAIYIWGAQLEQSSTVGEYIPTTSTINSAPRFDHNPTTGESLGLLVEEQRTNSIHNNTMVGAVAGTPGTTPTNWGISSSATGLTREIIGTGTESGITYLDVRYSGTSTSGGSLQISTDTTTGIPALTGQTWTGSSYVRLVGGSLPSSAAWTWLERDSGGVIVVSGSGGSVPITADSLNSQRRTTTRTLSGGATVANLSLRIDVTVPNATAVDVTLRIGLPQLEQGAFATSVIPTSTAAATRSADVASITGTNFSSWYSQSEGTVFAEWFGGPVAANKYPSVIAARQTSANNSQNTIEIFQGPSLTNVRANGLVRVLNVDQVARDSGDLTLAGTKVKAALGVRTNDFVFTANGVQVGAVDTSGTLLTVDTLNIGFNSSTDQLGGRISRLTYWPARLPNPTLQAITQ